MVVVATHYSAVKAYGYLTPGVVNAAVEFDEERLQPTYRLRQGVAGASNALEIARRVGLPEEIVAEARARMGASEEQVTRYLQRLKEEVERQHAVRAALEEERAAVAAHYEKMQREFLAREQRRQREFEETLRAFLETVSRRAEELLAHIADQHARRHLQRFAERRLAKFKTEVWQDARSIPFERAPSAEPMPRTRPAEEVAVKPGDRVRIRSWNQIGIVTDVEAEHVAVQIGALRVRADRRDLDVLCEPVPDAALHSREGIRLERAARSDVPAELNLIGKTVAEAVEEMDRFLDAAYRAERREVTIIHGTGVLRKAVREFLSQHPHVARFRPTSADGATIVELNERR
jgi:DNA mismatch repair protein MutS2